MLLKQSALTCLLQRKPQHTMPRGSAELRPDGWPQPGIAPYPFLERSYTTAPFMCFIKTEDDLHV